MTFLQLSAGKWCIFIVWRSSSGTAGGWSEDRGRRIRKHKGKVELFKYLEIGIVETSYC